MFMHVVVDPEAFTADEFESEFCRLGAAFFINGLYHNVFLIVDSEGELHEELLSNASEISKGMGQYILIRLTQALIRNRIPVIKCRPNMLEANPTDTAERCVMLAKACELDGVVAGSDLAEKFMFGHDVGVYTLSRYYTDEGTDEKIITCSLEEERQKYERGVHPFGQTGDGVPGLMSDEEAEDIFIRIIKFAKWLRFYDKQIGRANNISGYRKGIDYILELWCEHGHFARNVLGPVEIITSQAKPISGYETEYIANKNRRKNHKARKKLENELLKPLQNKFPWDLELRIKADPDNKFHARHLQAQQVVVHIDRGFDLFCDDRATTFKRNHIRLDKKSCGHLDEYRDLPEP